MLAAHVVLVLPGHRGDQLLLPLVADDRWVGIVMLNRLAPDVGSTRPSACSSTSPRPSCCWFAVGICWRCWSSPSDSATTASLRHYKYTWAVAGIALLIVTSLFGNEVNGARLWIYLGPIGFQPGEFIKIVLVLFIAGYLAEQPGPAAAAPARASDRSGSRPCPTCCRCSPSSAWSC